MVSVAEPVEGSLGTGYMIVIDWDRLQTKTEHDGRERNYPPVMHSSYPNPPPNLCGSYLIASLGSEIGFLDGTTADGFQGVNIAEESGSAGPIVDDDDVPF